MIVVILALLILAIGAITFTLFNASPATAADAVLNALNFQDDDEDDHDGTVQPPGDDIDVCKRGDYSVGGVATLSVKNVRDRRDDDDCFRAHAEDSSGVSGLPGNAGAVLSDLVVLQSVGNGTNVKICFAAPPGQKVQIYFYGQNYGGGGALEAYAAAGADCLYAPGIRKPEEISAIVRAVAPKPVNLLVHGNWITVSQAAELGVRRISIGGALAKTAWNGLTKTAQEIIEHGTFASLTWSGAPVNLNDLFR